MLKAIFLVLTVTVLAACGSSRSAAYNHKAVANVAEADRIVQGFSNADRHLYAAGIKEVSRTGSKPGQYTIAQILDQEKMHEDAIASGTYKVVKPTPKPNPALVAKSNAAYNKWRQLVQSTDPEGQISEGHVLVGYEHDAPDHISLYESEGIYNELSEANRDRLQDIVLHLHAIWVATYQDYTGVKVPNERMKLMFTVHKTTYYDPK